MTLTELENNIKTELKGLGGNVSLLVDFLDTDESIKINETRNYQIASVIKVLILIELFYQKESEKVDVNKRITLKQDNIVLGSGLVKILDHKTQYTLLDLAKLMITVSDNTATNELVDILGMENINARAELLGMEHTIFRHKMHIEAGDGPNISTSEDIALMLEKIYKKEVPYADEIIEIMTETLLRTRIPRRISGKVKVAHKNGTLTDTVHAAGIVYAIHPYSFTFLSDEQEDRKLVQVIIGECAKLCFKYAEQNN